MADVNEFGYAPEAWDALGERGRYRIRNKDKLREKKREYSQRPEVKRRANEKRRLANMTPEQIEKKRERARAYDQTPKGRRINRASANRYKQRLRDVRDSAREAERARRLECAPAWREENRTAMEADPKGIFRRVCMSIKPSWAQDVRDDVAQDIAVALLEGQISLHEIERIAGDFVKAHFRGRDWFETFGLDAIVPGTEDLTLADTLSNDHAWH